MTKRRTVEDEVDLIDLEIVRMLKRCSDLNICPCCIARTMLYRGSELMEDVATRQEAVEACIDAIKSLTDDEGASLH